MRQAFLLLLTFTLCLLAGCGGSGSAAKEPNLYTGIWSGTWDSPSLGQQGAFTPTIFSEGSMTGAMTITSLALTGTVAGTVEPDGQFTGTVAFGASGNYQLSGNFALASGRLVGSYTLRYQGQDYAGTCDLGGNGS